jgi:hypothetical protein
VIMFSEVDGAQKNIMRVRSGAGYDILHPIELSG